MKIVGQTKFESKKLSPKILGVKSVVQKFGLKDLRSQKFLSQKNRSKKNLSQRKFRSKILLVQKNLGSNKS